MSLWATVLHYKKYSSASDVWSYGAVMYEIWSLGHKPFENSTNQECIRLVDSGYRLPPPPGCPKPMNPDTHDRPSFSDISSSLSSPDKQLLMINKEDPVTVLGGALETSHSLYNDLQYVWTKQTAIKTVINNNNLYLGIVELALPLHIDVILVCFMSNRILLEVNGESCTEGFMDYSLLQARAASPSGSLVFNRLAETNATRWIIIEDSMGNDVIFTCTTVITEILIGVDIRTVHNIGTGRNLYPRFEYCTLTLPTPLNVSSGYRIGVYQPPDDRSVVRFHYMNISTNIDGIGKIQPLKINDTNIRISASRDVDYESWTILIHPIVQDTDCYSQLMAPDNITLSSSITDVLFISDVIAVFPDIRLTCHGIITNWIIVANSLVTATVKIRHANNLTTTALSVNISNAIPISSLLYNFTMSDEITVQPGDILMIESYYEYTLVTPVVISSLPIVIRLSVEVMSACCLLVILLYFMSNGILLEANGESCTEGFMDYSLLQGKATNPHRNLRNNRLSNYENPMVDAATR
uniref:Protein kinase domain-containing protein n=1 Tax=Amphimedon queenslandica TaxID=400682 RepID=A0A1X7TL07_AMPQE